MRSWTTPRRTTNNRGFTMLELMIVLAIISALAVLGGPAMNTWIQRARLNEATKAIERKMNTVRKLSMANRTRHCVRFTADTAYSNGGPTYLIGVTVQGETAPGSNTWVNIAAPPELAGWTNDGTTERYKFVSLESNVATTDLIVGTDNCAGFVYNAQGFLDNPTTDFPSDCDGLASAGAACNKMTLLQKAIDEQRTLWVDRAGGVRISLGPNTEPGA